MAQTIPVRTAIVAGYGPAGRAVVEVLERQRIAVTIVETNRDTVRIQTKLGKQIIHGDISDPQVLQRAGVDTAEAMILTVPNQQQTVKACSKARQRSSQIYISARTRHTSEAMAATQAGADEAIVDELVAAEAMQQQVLTRMFAGAKTVP